MSLQVRHRRIAGVMTAANDHQRGAQPGDQHRRVLEPALLTVTEAASMLAIGRTTVYELIAAGEIETIHIGRSTRIPTVAIAEFVAARRSFR